MFRFGMKVALTAVAFATLSLSANAATQLFGSAYVVGRGPTSFYSLNPANGTATLVGATGLNGIGAIDFAPNGTLYGAAYLSGPNDSELVTINPSTGVATAVGVMAVHGNVQDMAFRPSDGKLFVYSEGGLYTVNLATGAATLISQIPFVVDGNGMTFSGPTLYIANDGGTAPGTLWTVNQTTGVQTAAHTLSFAAAFVGLTPRINAMKTDSSGTVWVSVQTGDRPTAVNYIGQLNLSTGAVSFVGPTTSGLDGLAALGGNTSVPTLSDWSLLATVIALGLAGIWFISRQRLQA
jgi:hypothetical protein